MERKIEKVACNLYGASVVTYSLHSRKVIKLNRADGYQHYPSVSPKTQYSFSADPKIYGAVNNFEFHIKDIVVNNGAEMIVHSPANYPSAGDYPRNHKPNTLILWTEI